MTLINYMSRVHFADGVLEVALSAELELNRFSRPVLVSDNRVVSSEFIERVRAGMPFWCDCDVSYISPHETHQKAVTDLQKNVEDHRADVIVAFGSALSLRIADACCQQMLRYSKAEGSNSKAEGCSDTAPVLFAIPGVDGLPALSTRAVGGRRLASRFAEQGIQPAMVIIDPTLILGESKERTASAVANAMARCLSAQFSDAYNPPADGIALDGYKRIVRHLSDIVSSDSLEMRRELMAASLNGTLAMEKEPGIAHNLCDMIRREKPEVDQGALMRLLIVAEAQLMEMSCDEKRLQELCATLEVPSDQSLSGWLSKALAKLPLPYSLAELGIDPNIVGDAIHELKTQRSVSLPSVESFNAVVNAINLRGNPPVAELLH